MGPVPEIWVPNLVLAHVFALFWLVKAWLRTRVARGGVRPTPGSHAKADVLVEIRDLGSRDAMPTSASSTKLLALDVHPKQPEPLDLEWQALGCTYNVHGTAKVVLHNVWGRAQPGQMQALMGPSGAGKSTLMDMLALRKSVGTLTGRLLVNGKPATSSFIRRTSYVPQEDTFIPTCTTKETLAFYAGVTLGAGWTRSSKRERVAQVLEAVGLGHTADTLVGGTLPGGLMLRGLSGGERKRLSIAAGILGDPSVIYLDEPTSGLDSFAALSVMGHMRKLAQTSQQTVIATIHQPRTAIWQMFDTVSLLSSGRLMFHGKCADMLPWFNSLGYTCSPNGSESDWVLDLVATGFSKPEDEFGHTMRSKADIDAAADAFSTQLDNGKDDGSVNTASQKSLTGSTSYPTSFSSQFRALFTRELTIVTRNPFDVAAKVLTSTWVALLFSMLAYNADLKSIQGIQSTALGNYLFASVMCVLILPYVSISLYTADRQMYLQDASAKRYRASSYYLAKVLVSTPFNIVVSLCFTGLFYGLAGLSSSFAQYARFASIITLLSLTAYQVLHCCAVVCSTYDTTFAMSVGWTTIQLLLCSVFIPFSLTSESMRWLTQLRYIAASYYAVESITVNEFTGGMLDCSAGLASAQVDALTEALVNAPAAQKAVLRQLKQPQPGCVLKTDALLGPLGFNRPFVETFFILLGYLGIVHLLTFSGLILVARKERR